MPDRQEVKSFSTTQWHSTLPWGSHRFKVVKMIAAFSRILPYGRKNKSLDVGVSWARWWCSATSKKPSNVSTKKQLKRIERMGIDGAKLKYFKNFYFSFPRHSAIRLYASAFGKLYIYFMGTSGDGLPTLFVKNKIYLSKGGLSAKHDLIFIDYGRGVKEATNSAQVIENSFYVYKKLGVTEVYLTAGLSSGGAVWSKFGFVPISLPEWRSLGVMVRKNIASIPAVYLDAYKNATKEDLCSVVEMILARNETEAVWDLNFIDQDLDLGDAAIASLGSHGLSGLLLKDSRWRGVFRLTDAAFLCYVDAYLDKKSRAGSIVRIRP